MCKTCVVDILVGTKLHNSAFLLSVVFCNGLSVAERRRMGGGRGGSWAAGQPVFDIGISTVQSHWKTGNGVREE